MSTTPEDEWAAQVARATTRKPVEEFVTLHDVEATEAAAAAAAALTRARYIARRRLAEDTAEEELAAAVEADSEVTAAREAAEEATEAARKLQVVFHVRGLPPEAYDALQLAHPPTDEQELKGMMWNPHTFFPALLAACSVKPLTLEQAEAIFAAGNTGEAALLSSACRQVNEQGRMSLGKGLRPTPS